MPRLALLTFPVSVTVFLLIQFTGRWTIARRKQKAATQAANWRNLRSAD